MPRESPTPTLRTIGSYELVEKIAEGGMGAVYRARQINTGMTVAIKIIPADTARNPVLLKRFEQEFKAASLLDHPNIVKALDYCGTGPTPFLVMEFVDGESLGQRVERTGAVPLADAVSFISQVCDGLHKAHKQGLIHRDVKPDNILVTADGVAKLTDLGLVKDMEGELNLTRTGRGLGTPHFMAPEQFRDAKNADVKCDVYSLGATLYMMITGQIPFNNTNPLDCWMKKRNNDFAAPKDVNPAITDRVDWAVRRAMNSEPSIRPATCREFMEDLTGTAWRTVNPSDTMFPLGAAPAGVESDLWYMVYRDNATRAHTVKGTRESIRKNFRDGQLGDPSQIMVSRQKTGPFHLLKSVAEFRDLVIMPASGPGSKVPAPTTNSAKKSTTRVLNSPARSTGKDPASQVETEMYQVRPVVKKSARLATTSQQSNTPQSSLSQPTSRNNDPNATPFWMYGLILVAAAVTSVAVYVMLRN